MWISKYSNILFSITHRPECWFISTNVTAKNPQTLIFISTSIDAKKYFKDFALCVLPHCQWLWLGLHQLDFHSSLAQLFSHTPYPSTSKSTSSACNQTKSKASHFHMRVLKQHLLWPGLLQPFLFTTLYKTLYNHHYNSLTPLPLALFSSHTIPISHCYCLFAFSYS